MKKIIYFIGFGALLLLLLNSVTQAQISDYKLDGIKHYDNGTSTLHLSLNGHITGGLIDIINEEMSKDKYVKNFFFNEQNYVMTCIATVLSEVDEKYIVEKINKIIIGNLPYIIDEEKGTITSKFKISKIKDINIKNSFLNELNYIEDVISATICENNIFKITADRNINKEIIKAVFDKYDISPIDN